MPPRGQPGPLPVPDSTVWRPPAAKPAAATPGSSCGSSSGRIGRADRQGGWKIFDSSGRFCPPEDSVLSPDASLWRQERWLALTDEQRRGFAPLCPDLLVELAGPADEGPRGVSGLRRKMASYQAHGTPLGWLLLPQERAVEIWPATGGGSQSAPLRLERRPRCWRVDLPELAGLQLGLAEIWNE